MGIHRARYVWAVVALTGLAGCQSGGSSNLAFWKSNPLSSKTAATSKPQYPPKPSSQVANPADAKTATANGLATNSTNKASTRFPGAPTSFTAPASPPASPPNGTNASSGLATTASQRGSVAATSNAMDPVVSPQRGYYSAPTTANAKPADGAFGNGVSGNALGSYPSSGTTAASGGAPPASGFRSGAKDYTSSPMNYASSPAGSPSTGGATIPRFGTAADRSTPSSPSTAPAYEPTAVASRANPSSSPIGSSYNTGPASYGNPASAAGAAASGARSGPTDPFQAGSRASPYASTNSSSDRGNSSYGSPYATSSTARASGVDRDATAYANPFASQQASSTGSGGYDRAAQPNYRDYPSTDPSASRTTSPYPSTGGNYGPTNGRPASPTNEFRPPIGSAAPSGDYRPGNTGYQPPASDYRPGDTGYRPPATSPYRGPNGSQMPAGASSTDEPPPFRPGSTSDYVPKSANAGPSATTASRDLFGPRNETGVQPTGYTAGGPDYRR